MLSFWINIWDKQKKKQHNLTNCGRTKQAGVIACSVDAAILQVTQSFGWMCSRAEQCIRFVAAPTPFRCQNRLQSRALAAKEPKTVINQELDYVTGKKKGVRVIYILHKTLSPLKMDAAEPTGDRRLELTSAAGTGSLREEECGILVRGRLYNPLQRIFIYILHGTEKCRTR